MSNKDTDRELLELAAKAAGVALHFVNGNPKEITEHWPCDPTEGPQEREWDWNPLTDDGDALRLAVKLRLDICRPAASDERVCVWVDHMADFIEEHEGADPMAAARRAIVRAAAEIGRGA